MLNYELSELIEKMIDIKAKTSTVEIKSAHNGCPKRLYDTLSSFSNQDSGGVILFGIDENHGFSTVGVYDVQDLQKKVTEQCNQMIPPVRAVFTATEYNGVYICSVEVPGIELDRRPCYYGGAGKMRGSYVRVGDADLPMTDYEIYSFEAFRKHVHDDVRGVERATFDLLKTECVEDYVRKMKLDRPGFSRLNDEQVYELLAITNKGIPTISSILNFGIYPQGLLPQLAIIGVVIPGYELGDVDESGVRFLDNKRIEGTLFEMLEDSIRFCMHNMKSQTFIDSKDGKRKDRWEYPINAVREIILNALIHRDYSSYTEATPIQINFFKDRLEVHSPGGLYGRMRVEDLGKARPDLRNPVLATMSEFLMKTENRYSGIPTIYREMQKAGLPNPVFENRRNEFVVTLYNNEKKLDEKKDLVEFCRIPRTRKEIKDYLGIQTMAFITREYIQPLLDAGKLHLKIEDKPRSKNQMYYVEKEYNDKDNS